MDDVPTKTRIDNAKAFLKENPSETIACAATIFGLPSSTLRSSIIVDKKPVSHKKRGGQNIILAPHQVKAIHHFIRSLFAYNIQPSSDVVFSAIVSLKRAQHPGKEDPSKRWFRGWWKENGLHKITTQPLAVVRYAAAEEKEQTKTKNDMAKKTTARKRLKQSGSKSAKSGFTKEQAEEMIAQKKAAAEAEAKKERNAFMKVWRMERDTKIREGVIARREEKARLRERKVFQSQGLPIPPHLDVSIPDPEAEWKKTDVTWLEEQARKAKKPEASANEDDEDEDVTFILDTTGDSNLRQDFLALDGDSEGGGSRLGYGDEYDSDNNVE